MRHFSLRVFVLTLVFAGIIYLPFSLWAPARSISTILRQRPQTTPVQRITTDETKPSGYAGGSAPVAPPQPADKNEDDTPPIAADTETTEVLAPEILPTDTPQEDSSQTTIDDEDEEGEREKKGNSSDAVFSPFYRLDVPDKVAITFDDGPCPGMTEQYLEILETYDVQATFFVIGQQVGFYPETAKKIIAQGSEIGSHSWRHAPLDKLDFDQISTDLEKTAVQIRTSLGQDTLFFRPPYGRGSADVLEAAQELNQRLVYWDVDPRDWENHSPEKIIGTILKQVKPGSIIILHEGRQNTLAALPGIIESLQDLGLQPVSVSALLTAAKQKN